MRRLTSLYVSVAALAIVVEVCVGLADPVSAQSSYDRGYRNGYNAPLTGTPDSATEYGNGFVNGRIDREYDERDLIARDRRFEACLAAGGTDCEGK